MANDIQIFSYPRIKDVEAIENRFSHIRCKGWVYALEYGDMVKIGCSSKPSKRYAHLVHNGEDYAGLKMEKLAISNACVNFRQLEATLHNKFARFRKEGTELFNVPFDDIIKAFYDLAYDVNFVEADRRFNERNKKGTELLKRTIGKTYDTKSIANIIDQLVNLTSELSNLTQQQAEMLKKQSTMLETSIEQTRYYRSIAELLCGHQLGTSPLK